MTCKLFREIAQKFYLKRCAWREIAMTPLRWYGMVVAVAIEDADHPQASAGSNQSTVAAALWVARIES